MSPDSQGGLGQNWFVLQFEAEYAGEVAPVVQPDSGGSSQAGFFGPIGQRVRFRVPVALDLARRIELQVGIEQAGVKSLFMSVPVEMIGAAHFQHTVAAVRDEAHMYAQALREDDELLAVLLAAG